MPYPVPTKCPACASQMVITELACPECQTKVQGVFEGSALQRLTSDQLQFVETFLRCRGNIKEVERDLKISYPTVRSRLDQVIQSLGYSVSDDESQLETDPAEDVLEALDTGSLTFEEALERLQNGPNTKKGRNANE
ncbi:DUF2089 domain-containing protein [Alicyclobacillus ferrooxydans]|uniref:DUF2089 domain-containing protein n=1 Tax=Alicyclobacillus ferrooxydans TaxID=471514 RepID=A0A0P9EYP0_9BACL|nr:DUF2089 domain-containing protein [Alicyclobacillus ferrooxydans]KPV44250.1 hypothetical protein AN477_08105 [Alicyclobacillus ferrooxydans]